MVEENQFKKFLLAVFEELDNYESLRKIYYKKVGKYPKRVSKEILIDDLINKVEWNEEVDKKWMIDLLAEHRIKNRPWSALILKIGEDADYNRVINAINDNKCEFKGTALLKEGFYNISTSDNVIKGEYWYKFTRNIITENYEPKEIEYPTPIKFEIDFNKKLIYIKESEPKKLQKIKPILKEIGIPLVDAGLKSLDVEEANERMKKFLGELKNILEGDR